MVQRKLFSFPDEEVKVGINDVDYGTKVSWMNGSEKQFGTFRYPCTDSEVIVEESNGNCFRIPFKFLTVE